MSQNLLRKGHFYVLLFLATAGALAVAFDAGRREQRWKIRRATRPIDERIARVDSVLQSVTPSPNGKDDWDEQLLCEP